jgi:hypothetical protein
MMTVMLDGESYSLRPNFMALQALEQESGTGLVTLARRFAEGAFTLADCVAVLRAGILGAGGVVPANLGALIVAGGIAGIAGPVAQFLEAAITGKLPEGKA